MDSSMLQRNEKNLSMIKTKSRIEGSADPTIVHARSGGSVVSGSCCRTRPRFTVRAGGSSDRGKSPPGSPKRRISVEKEIPTSEEVNISQRGREVCTLPLSSKDKPRNGHSSPNHKDSMLSGFTNGFIVHGFHTTKEKPASEASQYLETSPLSPSIKVGGSRSRVNSDGNNSSIHSADEKESSRGTGRRIKVEDFDHRQSDALDSVSVDDVLNGSNILKCTYTPFREANEIRSPCVQNSIGSCNSVRDESPSLRKQTHETNGSLLRRRSDDASWNPASCTASDEAFHPREHSCSITSRHERLSISHDGGPSDYDYCSNACSKTLDRRALNANPNSSPHSTDSLLSPQRITSVEGVKDTKGASEYRKHCDHDRNGPIFHNKLRDRKRKISVEGSTEYTVFKRRNMSRSPRSSYSNDWDAYNEKSREIFRQDKEAVNAPNKETVRLTSPFYSLWQSPCAMAAFQAASSSFPQNSAASTASNHQNMLIVSSPDVATANPLLLGVSPYLINPYMFQNCGSSEVAAAAAYSQVQRILQNYSAINFLPGHSMLGSPGLHPGLNPLHGNKLVESSRIAANAIAASMGQNVATLLSNSRVQCPTLPQILGQMEDFVKVDAENANVKASPFCLPSSWKRMFSSEIGSEVASAKHHHRAGTVWFDSAAFSGEDSARKPSEKNKQTPPKLRNFGSGKTRSDKHSMDARAPQEPALHTRKKRNSPLSPIPLSSQFQSVQKSKLCATPLSTKFKKHSVEFQMGESLKPPKTKKGERNISRSPPVVESRNVVKDSLKSSRCKDLTQDKRLVANARERTRVHTISSAFEELRRQIPSYSCSQKLSKLAIIRIACSYIKSLSVMAGRSYGTFKQSVDQCTRVLQAESRAGSRRKSNKALIECEIANYERGVSYDGVVGRNADVARRCHSPEISHPVCQRRAIRNSPSQEGMAQVQGQSNSQTPNEDSLRFRRQSSRDFSPSVASARSEHADGCANPERENAAED